MQTMKYYTNPIDYYLLSCICLLTILGIFVLYSGTDQNLMTLFKQISKLSIAFAMMYAISHIHYRVIDQMGLIFFVMSILTLLAVYFFGSSGKGAQRWLDLGIIKFQPSEIVKLTLPLALASWLSFRTDTIMNHFISLMILALPCLLIIIQPDLGTGILIGVTGLLMILIAGFPFYLIITGITLFVCASPIVWHYVLHDYQKMRIITFLNPGLDSMGGGYHIIQSKIAIGSGGLFGKGWLNGTQSHLSFLPEHATDFVFGIIGEEFGFIGAFSIILLIFLITQRILNLAMETADRYQKLVLCGLATNFFVCSVINIGMVIGVFPVVGIPLPLISYGGTHATILILSFGVVFAMIRASRSR